MLKHSHPMSIIGIAFLKMAGDSVQLIQKHLRFIADQSYLLLFMALSWLTDSPIGMAGQTLLFSPCSFGSDLLQPAWMWVSRPLSCMGAQAGNCVSKLYFQRWLTQRHKHKDGSTRYRREVDCSTIVCCKLQTMCSASPAKVSRWKLSSQLLTWNLIHLNCEFSAFTFINCCINH